MCNLILKKVIELKKKLLIQKVVFNMKFQKNQTTIEVRGSLNKFPAFFRMGTFIDSKHMKL